MIEPIGGGYGNACIAFEVPLNRAHSVTGLQCLTHGCRLRTGSTRARSFVMKTVARMANIWWWGS